MRHESSWREKRALYVDYANNAERVEYELARMARMTSELMRQINWNVQPPQSPDEPEVSQDSNSKDDEPKAAPAFSSELLESNPTDFESRREFYVRSFNNPDKVTADLHYIARRAHDLTDRIDQGQRDRSFHDHDYVTLEVPESEFCKLYAPVRGEVVPLWELDDARFSDGSCGEGLAILPSNGLVVAPATCRITAQLPSRNAVGLLTQDGIELLLVVGSEAESYTGGGFRQLAWQNDTVRRGTPLISWDRRMVARAGYNDVVVLVITNTEALSEVRVLKWGEVKEGDLVAKVSW